MPLTLVIGDKAPIPFVDYAEASEIFVREWCADPTNGMGVLHVRGKPFAIVGEDGKVWSSNALLYAPSRN